MPDSLFVWSKESTGDPFSLFCTAHLVTLAVLVLLNGSFLLLRRPGCGAARTAFRYAAAFLLLGVEALSQLWALSNDEWTVRTMLPFQLCSVSQYLGAVMLLTRSRRLYELVYFIGIGGALPALLTPDLGIYNFPHFRFWEYTVSHVLIVSAPLYLTLAEGYRPRPGSPVRVLAVLNLYMVLIGLFNYLVGSNYLFLSDKPMGPTLFDVLGPWPWYIASLEVGAVLVVLLLYSPFALRDWLARRTAAAHQGPHARPVGTISAPRFTDGETGPSTAEEVNHGESAR
jgi:hypothetical integral membrane protein (TIGR02206 family)